MAYYDSYQEELKTFMDMVSTTQEFADAVSKGTEETAKFLVSKAMEWAAENPEPIFNAVFGKDAVKNSGIDVENITKAYELGNKIVTGVEILVESKGFIDSISKLSAAQKSGDDLTYIEELPNMTNCFLDLTQTVIGEIPLAGSIYNLIIGEIQNQFNKGVDIIQNHVAQLKYTEAMCDYYSDIISLNQSINKITNIRGLNNKSEIIELLSMEEVLQKSGVNGNTGGILNDLINKGNEIYNSMTDDEKRDYGKDWPYDTTDDTKQNSGKITMILVILHLRKIRL